MPNVSVRIDGLMIATVLGVGAAAFLYLNRKELINKVNPASRENFIYQSVAGEDGTIRELDYVFAGLDLINPFNESDAYAEQLYGLD